MDTRGDYAGELQVAFDDGSSLTVRHPVTRDITYRDTPTEATIHWEHFYSCLCTSTGVAVELREPVAMYVDSVGDSAQGEYLKLRTALVLLCRAVLPECLQLINAKLLLTALKESDEDSQLDLAVRWATRQDAALVEHVLGQHAPDLVAAVDRVLASTPADHVDLSHRTLESFVEDLAICRTLFFAPLGSVIGYNGSIWHWQGANDGQSMMYVLGQRSDSKPSVFNVTATLPAEDLAFHAWPTFEAPSLPNHPVLRALDSFAAALEQRAGGAVRASLQAQPADEDGNRYNFKILLVRSPNIQATVFSVIERDGGMFIEGWRENDDSLRVDDTRVLNEFMNNTANSSTMRRLVMTYMILDSELSRGER